MRRLFTTAIPMLLAALPASRTGNITDSACQFILHLNQ